MIQETIPDDYIGPFSNWPERHAFIVGLTLGVASRDANSHWIFAIAAFLAGSNVKIRQEILNQPHYFLVGLVAGRYYQ
jgi:hypothetical protein